ncbi:putative methylcobalamin:homocysteine methyltransferase [Aeropyrum pernix K1]|uniref:Methylcobalamin:homocysteine methyltransferase n=1 Tax=Aeropyrum pernix (strain ATCC 700893 / DSM 11879 / JCM 9820 / NBRC 100138 / K1) TaxID=272557 RepID=Q9YA89_AERPE|nr:methylcobalamin--homocysteine methyltransferase [Aeropyrum pernix]BAA81060.2 putative methylcobalamin:homocysteine methyltransferase [Aeropyrum pernix K1]
MIIQGQVLGGYPRSRYVRRALRRLEQGEISAVELMGVLNQASSAVIGAQVSQGFPYVVDGMLDWHDIFRPFAEAWRNVTPTGLLRYFDNNFFYRIPLFTGEPEPTDPVLAPRVLSYSQVAEPAKLKVVVPGPVTFTLMSRNESGISDEELAEAIANLLADEVEKAVKAGAGFVQVDEPILSEPKATRDHALLAAELAGVIASRSGSAETMLSVYFYPPKPEVYEALLEARVDYLMVDLVAAGSKGLEVITGKGAGEGLALGVIDARSIYSESLEKVEAPVRRIVESVKPEKIILTTSTWLDLIPYRYALRKTALLGRYTYALAEKLGAQIAVAGGE